MADGQEELLGDLFAEEKSRLDTVVLELSMLSGQRYKRQTSEASEALLQEMPDAKPAERLLLRLAAAENVLSEVMGKGQMVLAEKIAVTRDGKAAFALTKALKELTQTRATTTRRAQELVQAVVTMRLQERLADGAGGGSG